jgi:Lantibiotic biosynthesis dehydratase C-term
MAGNARREHWVEINLYCARRHQDAILLDHILPCVRKIEDQGDLVTWHYFREPEIRLRVRMRGARARRRSEKSLGRLADSLKKLGLVDGWHFGSHGEEGVAYSGEEERYGKEGWKAAQDYFRHGSETAILLLGLKREGLLENPLWGKSLGNPWEGGEKNPWRKREDDPLVYHWSRYVHLFSNQLGFDMRKEADLASQQAEGYRKVNAEFGMEW